MNEQFFGDWDWLQEILRMSNTGLWAIIVDREQGKCYMHAGNVMLRLLGLKEHPSPEECYQHWYSRIEEKYRMQVKHALEKVIDTGKFLEVQFCWKHPWWGDVFVRCGGRAETREDGQIQIKGYFQNINELELLKQENKLQDAEIEEIKEQKRKYDELFASVLCGIVNYRVNDGKIMVEKINQEALRILHYTEEEFNRRESWDISELIASKDLPYIERGLKKLKKPGDKSGRELRVLTKEGEKRWIIENTELKENRDGSLMFQSVFLDINDDKEKTVLLEEITENIPGGVCLIDLDDFTLLYGNEGYYDLHGCSEQEMKEIYKERLKYLYSESG